MGKSNVYIYKWNDYIIAVVTGDNEKEAWKRLAERERSHYIEQEGFNGSSDKQIKDKITKHVESMMDDYVLMSTLPKDVIDDMVHFETI